MKINTENTHNFDRSTVISLLTNAIQVESFRFARRLAQAWLDIYSGDLVIEHLYAQACLKENRIDEAVPLIKKIVYTDPEYLPAQRLLAYSTSLMEYQSVQTAQECIRSLGGRIPESKSLPGWSDPLIQALRYQKEGSRQQAELAYQHTLAQQPDSPLAHVLHLKFMLDNMDQAVILSTAERYAKRWPDTLACILIYADALIKSGQEEEGINLLHHAVSLDIGGQVALRIWGAGHGYINLWPESPRIELDLPIPADVATAVGWNQLPAGRPAAIGIKPPEKARNRYLGKSRHEIAESRKAVSKARRELEELAVQIHNPDLGVVDARYPAYVILTAKNKLESQYGSENLTKICDAITLVERTTKQIKGWNAYTIYIDDPMCADAFGLPPSLPDDPWSIKNFIQDLDKSLATNGERIGAILIVGGNEVVPFHLLPNPLDDFDVHVPSDNPYACEDENYFIPKWPLGRLPGSSDGDPAALLNQLQKIIKAREEQAIKPMPSGLNWWLRWLFPLRGSRRLKPNFGYSAEVWRRASHAVYRPIGKPHHLKISPPVTAKRIGQVTSSPSHLAYFNLHGLEDAAEWYGQRDPVEGQLGPDYPIALRPADIRNSGAAPKIVFSEACFGANIIDKRVEEAICLKFLDSGTQALIGSTCTSYGSITTPLIAADLLGKTFWSLTQDGYPAGEALRRAKIHLAKEMDKRQGYLDGEDQKTLISFVLYGDPLASAFGGQISANAKLALQPNFNPERIKMVSDKANLVDNSQVPEEVIRQVKGIVEDYLPGMQGAKFSFAEGQATDPKVAKSTPTRKVITLSKQIVKDETTHNYHARITLNGEGKMTKLAVSR
ncbi:MAG: hypothetical protein JW757_09125 [Anaerolineales bacterium]|nr:hypothetical protein [Anaerolineales bacterium]